MDGTALVITFTETLAAAANLANSAFTVKVDGTAVTLGGTPSISGMTVTLTLAAAVAHDDTVTVSYTRPATDDSNRLQDADGNETASFSDAAVTNNTADTDAPAFESAAVDGTSLVITFTETLAAAANLANSAFTVKVDDSAVNLSSTTPPSISDATVTLTLAAAVAHDDTVAVSYTRPATDDSNRLEDTAGNETASFTDAAVTNNTADTTAPAFSSAAVDGTALVITFDETLAAAANLANSAFTVKVDGTAVSLGGTPSISGMTVTLTLAAAVAHDDTVTVSYTRPATDDSNRLEDAEGNETASFTDAAVTNNTADTEAPAFESAAVNGTSLGHHLYRDPGSSSEPGQQRVHGEGGRQRGHPGRDADNQRDDGNADPGRCGSARRHGDGKLREASDGQQQPAGGRRRQRDRGLHRRGGGQQHAGRDIEPDSAAGGRGRQQYVHGGAGDTAEQHG